MLPDWVSNPGPLTNESDALPIALRGRVHCFENLKCLKVFLKEKSALEQHYF